MKKSALMLLVCVYLVTGSLVQKRVHHSMSMKAFRLKKQKNLNRKQQQKKNIEPKTSLGDQSQHEEKLNLRIFLKDEDVRPSILDVESEREGAEMHRGAEEPGGEEGGG